MISKKAIAFAAGAALGATPLAAKGAGDLSDLVGARAGQAENAVQSRGFTYITGHEGKHSTMHTYWWNSRDKACVHIKTSDGRYESITDATNADCHQSGGGGDAAAAVGVVAGAVLLGALLGGNHKKGHHDDGNHYSNVNDEAHYERGYQDGLHNVAYHNYDRSDAYSSGYSNGVEQREINTRHHSGRGGYAQIAQYNDLVGRSGEKAREILGERGFTRVDRFGDDNTRYSIMWRAQSRQCLQMIVADGRVYDIRDIGQHPNCR
ncbi:hypothetical protein G6N82_09515 [Altererythrobacter sp. BO-6]|uniref:hypothetical protein n=1 Tax=Altererythrobacter sp. BO-6 TaxID=2604537 RepID=UPI0013E1BA2D|nr:hypothetical protein [Altererythrobacter sp. BO-6]QIG54353.1 hypothetical protein G6N82_09515 [Altererythrobacter sp. BO-6]